MVAASLSPPPTPQRQPSLALKCGPGTPYRPPYPVRTAADGAAQATIKKGVVGTVRGRGASSPSVRMTACQRTGE